MKDIVSLLWMILGLLALILWCVYGISKRLKERFPTEKEEDYRWSQNDPVGHSEAHKGDGKKTK
jgi:hypothetical protein